MTSNITTALNSAVSGLRVTQKQLDVTAANISNSDTEGYTKKSLPQEHVLIDGVGVGVRYNEVTRYVDKAMQRDYRTQLGMQNYSKTMEAYLSRIIGISGATDSENNIGSQMGNLYSQMVSLSASPDSTASQNAVITSANNLAMKFNNFALQLQNIRNDTQVAIKAQVDSLNNALQGIADVNSQIANALAIGRSTAELEDRRDAMVKQVAGQINVNYYTDGQGVLVLQTEGGHVLADREARPISFTNSSLNAETLYPSSPLVSGVLLQENVNGPGFDLASIKPGGTIGALLQMRDETIPSYNAQLDELADKTMRRFADQGLTLFTDKDGTVPPNDPATYAGIASRIKVNPNVASNPSLVQQGTGGSPIAVGSTEIIDKVINYTFGKYKDAAGTPNVGFNLTNAGYNNLISFTITGDANASLQTFANAFIDNQGNDYNTAKTNLTTESGYANELETKLLDGSAVNSDEEMTKLILYQRSYGASAKMITALNDLFRELLNAI